MKTLVRHLLSRGERESLLKRPSVHLSDLFPLVRKVIKNVRERGDRALRDYTAQFDGVSIGEIEVQEKELRRAGALPERSRAAILQAAKQIARVHSLQNQREKAARIGDEIVIWREGRGIEKVGLYAPGGSHPFPSTVLMLGIPSKIAQCEEVILCTPPRSDGSLPPEVLFAAEVAGIRRIFKVGGAQAIASMAYGTETIPKVEKIFGPGNAYVLAAKILVSMDPEGAAIDLPAGPSELLVIADEKACFPFVAADLLSQAEHGPDSQVILVTPAREVAREVDREMKRQIASFPRKEIARKALARSFILVTASLDEAVQFANDYAPEHLILHVADPARWGKKIRHAGTVFLGPYSPGSAGDYASGANHTLPTSGYARCFSGLSVESFMKKVTFQHLSRKGLERIRETVETLAEMEGLLAHREAVSIRFALPCDREGKKKGSGLRRRRSSPRS